MNTPKKSYVAPAKRKQEIKEKGLSQDELNDEKMFPTLCEAGPSIWNKSKKSFKNTIDTLIASEKLSEQEKLVKLEAQKAMEGWQRLILTLRKEDYLHFNELILTNTYLAREMEDNWYYKPNTMPTTTYADDNISLPSISENLDYTDSESDDSD